MLQNFPERVKHCWAIHFTASWEARAQTKRLQRRVWGADVCIVGAVGDDDFGYEMTTNLCREGIFTEHIQTLTGLPSGMANITVADDENAIIVIAGANMGLTVADIENADAANRLRRCGFEPARNSDGLRHHRRKIGEEIRQALLSSTQLPHNSCLPELWEFGHSSDPQPLRTCRLPRPVARFESRRADSKSPPAPS